VPSSISTFATLLLPTSLAPSIPIDLHCSKPRDRLAQRFHIEEEYQPKQRSPDFREVSAALLSSLADSRMRNLLKRGFFPRQQTLWREAPRDSSLLSSKIFLVSRALRAH
jgi:hypothetical protein